MLSWQFLVSNNAHTADHDPNGSFLKACEIGDGATVIAMLLTGDIDPKYTEVRNNLRQPFIHSFTLMFMSWHLLA